MSNEAQRRIDDEISRLNSSLCDLGSQRNAFSLISRLPAEVLAYIFVLGASDYYYQENHPRPNSGAPDWVNVSYICRHWRNVALDCPTLWTYVIMSSEGFTEMSLARSKQRPLKICIETDQPLEKRSMLFQSVLADHAERIQELRFLDGTARRFIFPSISFSRITRLQVLEVDARFDDVEWGVIHRAIPTLRRLKASNCCSIPWDSFQPSGLTSLSLVNIREDHQLDIVELQSYLGCMHDLVHLHLWNALCGNAMFLGSLDFDPTRKLTLAHLSRLLIAAPLSTIVAFLSYIKIPSKTKMNLQCYDELVEDDQYAYHDNDCSSLYMFLHQLYPSGDQALFRPTSRTFSIRYSDRELLLSSSERYGHCPRSQCEPEVFWDCDIPLQLGIKFVSTERQQDWIISNICRSVSSKDVRSVHIRSLQHLSTFWKNSLGHFQEVRHLKVTNSNIAGLASALSLTSSDDAENQDGHVGHGLLCAPALEELECISCWIDVEQDKANLRTALSIRKERGRALKRLVIKNNAKKAFSPKDVLDLPVGDVCLDGW